MSKLCKEYLTKSKEYAEKSVFKSRALHAENIGQILVQIKCCLKLQLFEEMSAKMAILYDIVKYHLGDNHPILIPIFEEIGDYFI